MDNRLLIVIAGPTASGKSDLAVEIAEHFKTEIISADSRQCYRELSIGTAKPDDTLLARVRHHFIDSHTIQRPIHAGEFVLEGRKVLDRIFSEKPVAVMVGGTGMYIDALIQGMDSFPAIDEENRAEAARILQTGGPSAACDFLSGNDPEYLKVVDRANPSRLRRAIEVILQSGLPYSTFLNRDKNPVDFATLKFVPEIDRPHLYERIDLRVDRMIKAGLLDEVNRLIPFRNQQALHTVGYTELFQYLDGTLDLQTAISLIKQHSRNYAKRQLTWFRNKGEFRFVPHDEAKAYIIREASMILQ